MAYNCKNYTDEGGDRTVIGGKLVIEEGAEVEGLPSGASAIAYIDYDSETYVYKCYKDKDCTVLYTATELRDAYLSGLLLATPTAVEGTEQYYAPVSGVLGSGVFAINFLTHGEDGIVWETAEN